MSNSSTKICLLLNVCEKIMKTRERSRSKNGAGFGLRDGRQAERTIRRCGDWRGAQSPFEGRRALLQCCRLGLLARVDPTWLLAFRVAVRRVGRHGAISSFGARCGRRLGRQPASQHHRRPSLLTTETPDVMDREVTVMHPIWRYGQPAW